MHSGQVYREIHTQIARFQSVRCISTLKQEGAARRLVLADFCGRGLGSAGRAEEYVGGLERG